jgi:predicted ester cyclase
MTISRDDVVFVEFTITGTHDGELKGVPPTGRHLELQGMEKFRVVDGRIQEMHAYFDTRAIPEQLGLTFPAVIGQLPKLVVRKVL